MEAHQSIPGGNLMDALQNTEEWRAGGPESESAAQESETERENARSLAQLQMMMHGVAK